jgi:hypothetical protein
MDESTSSEGSATTDGNALPNRDPPDVTRFKAATAAPLAKLDKIMSPPSPLSALCTADEIAVAIEAGLRVESFLNAKGSGPDRRPHSAPPDQHRQQSGRLAQSDFLQLGDIVVNPYNSDRASRPAL